MRQYPPFAREGRFSAKPRQTLNFVFFNILHLAFENGPVYNRFQVTGCD